MDWTGCNTRTVGLLTWLALFVCALGCQSGGGQASFANPFMTPDRVPPPTTRSLVPGSAQPYYPGDPVPVLQGATPMSQPALAAPSTTPPPITPITAAPIPSQTYVSAPAGYAPVTMPTMSSLSQFAPTAQPSAPQNLAPAVTMNNGVQPAVFNQPANANNYASDAGFATPQQQFDDVADTGFSQPALPAAADPRVVLESQPPAEVTTAQLAEEQVPWRSPLGGSTVAGVDGYQPVELQAVPAVFPQGPIDPNPPPRVRIPSSAQAGFDSQAPPANYTAPLPGVPQTVAITELPSYPPGVAVAPPLVSAGQSTSPWQSKPTAPAATASYYGGSTDGFRPRGSMR